MIKKALICYLSFSGNTQEIAELIEKQLEENGIEVEKYEIGRGVIPSLDSYDIVFLGTFTWDMGSTPDEIKDFVLDVGYKPDNITVFGSGDTQFGGDELFCRAVDRLAKFYNSIYPVLKIEQSPRGSQEVKVIKWVNNIINR